MNGKRKPSETWATRPLPPLTIDELERHLDTLSVMMMRAGPKAHLLMPVWRRVKAELLNLQEEQAIMREARSRAVRYNLREQARLRKSV